MPLRLAGAVLVVLLFGLPMFYGLGQTDLDSDEALYADIAQQMATNGEWLTLRDATGTPFLEKPPLKFWLVAAGLRAGWLAPDERGFRIWDPLLATLAFLYVYALGIRLESPLCGLVAVLFLFLHQPLLFWHGLRANTMESLMVLAYCGGMYHFLAWAGAPSRYRERAHLAALGLWLACGVLGKFVAILFLPLVVAATLLWHPDAREKARADWRGWSLAALITVGASLPWYAQQSLEHGSSFWRTLLVDHVLRRFTASLDTAHLHAWSYYLEAAWGGTKELSLVVVPGLLLWVARALRDPWLPGRAVLLWWALPLAVLSFGTSKLAWYAYPFLPPLGLFGGYAVSRAARSWNRSLVAGGWRDSRALRAAAGVGAVLAWTIALATAWQGPVRVEWLHFSSSTLERPLLVGALLAHFALSRVRAASGLMAAIAAVVVCWASYSRVWRELGVRKRPAASLVECLALRRGSGLWMMADAALLHHYDHYLRRFGVARIPIGREGLKFGETPAPPPDAAILVERSDLLEFGRLGWWRKRAADGRLVDGGDSLLLLSGSYRDCARPPSERGGPFLPTR